jgi:CRISPR/Cas system-associated exonuclease Cas4 (RecB family)
VPDTILREGKPRILVTWLAKLLAGEAQCFWATWFKARHVRYVKAPQDKTNLAIWSTEHTAQVFKHRVELERDGYQCTTERENEFEIVGKAAIVAGKPDIVASNSNGRLVVDEKTGQPRESDRWQVLIYCYADKTGGFSSTGMVRYSNGSQPLYVSGPTAADISEIAIAVRIIAGQTPPPRTPSRSECKFCDITECQDRYVEKDVETVTTDF